MVDIIFTKKTLCIPSPKSCLFCGLNLVGLLCCFLGKTLYSHSTSLNPGVKMGTAALPGKPVMKCLGVTLQWTCIPLQGCHYAPICFMLCKLGWASLHGSLSSTTHLRLTNTFFQLVTFITRVHPSFTLTIIIYSFSLLCLHQTFLTTDNHYFRLVTIYDHSHYFCVKLKLNTLIQSNCSY